MSAVPTPPALLEVIHRSEATWQSDLHEMFELAKERFPDILWGRDEDDDDTRDPGKVWGHKAIVYARAPPSWQAKYFLFRPAPIGSNNQSTSPSLLFGESPPFTTHSGLLRLPTINPATFPNELEYLYTARGLTQAFEFLFDKPPESGKGDEDETRLERLREDLVFMWRSHLYSDIKISLTDALSDNNEGATTVFSSHRFILVSRSPYFYTILKSRGKTANAIVKAAHWSGDEEPLTVTLPSPPFTPASLHFTLGYMYAGTLVFSHETYDLETAFQIMRSAAFLSIQPLYDEIQARIVQEMMHGLFHASLEFAEYERITGGKWGVGGCRCRQCARRAPRVLEFAIAADVKNQHLERGARRALVGMYGEGWCTPEFFKLSEEIKLQLIKGLAKRTTPMNIFPLLFATHHALRKLGNILDSRSVDVEELVLSARKTIDEVLCNHLPECFEQQEWVEIMAGDGIRFDGVEKVDWVMESIKRGLNDSNAPFVYQTLVSSILLKPHPTEPFQAMLPASSRIRFQTEQTRIEVTRWLKRRWIGVRQAGGFNQLEGWSLKELSEEIEVPINNLINPEIPENLPRKHMIIERRTEEPERGSKHSSRAGAVGGGVAQLPGAPTDQERAQISETSVRAEVPRTPPKDGTPRERLLNPGPRPDQKFAPASSSSVSPIRPAPQVDRNGRAMLSESSGARDYTPKNPVVRVDSPHALALRKGPTLLSADPRIIAPEYRPTDPTSKLQPRASTIREVPPTLKTSSNGPSPVRNRDLTAQSTERPSITSGGSITSTTSTRRAETSSGFTSPPSTQPTSRELSHEIHSLAVRKPEVSAKESISGIRRRLETLSPSDEEYRPLLLELLGHQDLSSHVHDLQEPDLRGFIELLDKALNNLQVTDYLFRKTLHSLRNTCGSRTVLPSSCLVPREKLLSRGRTFAVGTLTSVHTAEFGGGKVCIKVLRPRFLEIIGAIHDAIHEVFCAEVVLWKRLKHPNVVPFLGVPTEVPPPFEVVLDWMENGTITEYVTKHPQVDAIDLLWDVADGLHYLHSCEVIHGTLEAANILIDKDGRARLAGFELTSMTRAVEDLDTTGTTIWAAREALGAGPMTKEGDVFRFGILVVEVVTGRAPFLTNREGVIFKMGGGVDFIRPTGLSHDGLWTLVQMCWHYDLGKRPTTSQLLESFRELFPRERETPESVPSLGSASVSVGPKLHAEKPLPHPSGQSTTDICKLGPQDPSVSSPWIAEPEPSTLVDEYEAPVPAWKHLISCPLPVDERISLIMAIFSDRSEVGQVNHLCGEDAQTFVDVIDETLDMLAPKLQRNCLDTLRKICSRQGLLPRSVQIQLLYSRSDTPLYQGGFADIWKSQYQGYHVAVKVLRVCTSDNFRKITSRFCKEVVTWKTLCHPNVLPLLGVVMADRHFVMVSEWMDNGNINEFIKANQGANRFELLKDITRGLIYMHDREMIHGDLKGANILIDQSGHARLADFGLLTVISDPTYATASSSKVNSGTVPWMSPELLYPERYDLKDSQPTKESDYYALGMVIFEVLSGQPPFAGYKGFIVTRKVIDGERPERPESPWFTDDLWGTLRQCWLSQPEDRPTAQNVLGFLDQV